MYGEDDLCMISALQHFLFCPRQCALIHIEQQWVENVYTAEGRVLHERVHNYPRESRRKTRVEFDLPIRSLALGVVGRADIVEFNHQDSGFWQPFPVEYKRGKPKENNSDQVQLCAQAVSLEEMLDCSIPAGALYYGKKKRRAEVIFDHKLREITFETARQLHELLKKEETPPPAYDTACRSCSFFDACLPELAGKKDKVARYFRRMLLI